MVSYCDIGCPSCIVCQQLLQRISPPNLLGGFLPNTGRNDPDMTFFNNSSNGSGRLSEGLDGV